MTSRYDLTGRPGIVDTDAAVRTPRRPTTMPTTRHRPARTALRRTVAFAVVVLAMVAGAAGSPAASAAVPASAATGPVVAHGGTDRITTPGTLITLDGRPSTGAEWYRWRQVMTTGAVPVDLVNADSPVATFTFPAGSPGLRFALIVSGPEGSSTDIVDVVLAPTRPVLVTTATWSAATGRWTVAGRTNRITPVTVTLGSANGPRLGTAMPDPMGRWILTRTSTTLTADRYRGVVARTATSSHQLPSRTV